MSQDSLNQSQSDSQASVDGFQAYCEYVSLKAHFNREYDWKKYQGKIHNISRQTYEKRRDKVFFEIIQSKYSGVERNQIFLANFVYNRHLWIGELLAENCISIWNDWKGRISRMEYQFEEDIKTSLAEIQTRKSLKSKDALKFLIKKPDDTHPLILRFVWGGMFSIESYLLISSVLNLRKVYHPFLREDKLWADFEHKVEKYENFLGPKLNLKKAKEILIELTKE